MTELTEEVGKCGFNVVNEGHRSLWVSDETEFSACTSFGKDFVEKVSNK